MSKEPDELEIKEAFTIRRYARLDKVCELPMCIPAKIAKYEVEFKEPACKVLLCKQHGEGVMCLAEYTNTKIELEGISNEPDKITKG